MMLCTTSLQLSLLLCLIYNIPISFAFITCPASGYKQCTSADVPYTISTPMTLSNCIYDGCPQLIILNSAVTLSGVTFKNSDNTGNRGSTINGGCIYIQGTSTVTVQGSTFYNCTAPNDGGGIYSSSPNALTIVNTVFDSCRSGSNGGGVRVISAVDTFLTNVNFINCFSNNGGGYCAGTGGTAIVGGICSKSNSSSFGGCYYTLGSTYMTLDGVYAADTTNPNGGGIICVNGVTPVFTIKNSYFARSYAPIFLNAPLNLYGLNMTNSTITDFYGGAFVGFVGDAVFNGVNFLHGSGKLVNSGRGIYIINSLMRDNVAPGPLMKGASDSYFINSTALNNIMTPVSRTGIFLLNPHVNGYFLGSYIANNTGAAGTVAAIWGQNLIVLRDTLVENNIATNGGVFYLDQVYALYLQSNVTIRNNIATNRGGVAYFLSPNGNVTFDGPGIVITGNVALATPSSSFFFVAKNYINTVPVLAIGPNVGSPKPYIDGGFYIQHNVTANFILNSAQKTFFSDYTAGSSFFAGTACYLSVANMNSLLALNPNYNNGYTNLFISQSIPPLMVTALDYFGRIADIDPTALVVIIVSETKQRVDLQGETTKAIADVNNNPLPFVDLAFPNPYPGLYNLTFVGNNLSPMPALYPMQIAVPINYLQCDAVSQRFVASAMSCFDARPMSSGVNAGISAVSLICSILVIISLLVFGLKGVAEGDVRNIDRRIFKITLASGSAISLLSLVPFLAGRVSASCIASTWIENLGFAISMGSVAIRIARLKREVSPEYISNPDKQTSFVSNLVPRLAALFVLTLVFQAIWTVVDPLSIVESINSAANLVTTDACSYTEFSSISLFVRFFATFATAMLALSAGSYSSSPDEVKALSLFTYNWLIFGCILSIIAEALVSDTNTSFIIYGIALIIPNTLGAISLITLKVDDFKSRGKDLTVPSGISSNLAGTGAKGKSNNHESGNKGIKGTASQVESNNNITQDGHAISGMVDSTIDGSVGGTHTDIKSFQVRNL